MIRVAATMTALALAFCSNGWAQSLKSFPPGNHVEVTVGAYLIDFDEIAEETLTYTVSAYITATWHDPRLVKGSAPDLDRDGDCRSDLVAEPRVCQRARSAADDELPGHDR